jgi:hypothetical protein
MTLVKASLQAVGPGAQNPPPVKGEVISVQLNPTSLRYQLNNNVDVGKAFGRSASQAQGSSSATLQFDLVFDTADEGSTADPVDVRSRTKKLEQFLLPDKKSPKSAPPRVKFTYGTFSVIGVMSALNQDYELFAETGVPLRAKLSVTIKEQKPEFDAGQTGAGANTGAAARPMPGSGGGAGGGGAPAAPAAPADRTGTALAGESAADFAVRMGLDPGAWKTFAAGLGDTLSLTAGLRIDFSASAGVGFGVGVGVGLGEQTGATAGVGGGAGAPSRDVSPSEAAAAGGVAKAIEGRAATAAVAEAAATRQAFGAPTATGGEQRLDGRAVSYGKGVPLRPRVGAADQRVEPLVVHTRCGKRDAS